jgi:hypothetical protein
MVEKRSKSKSSHKEETQRGYRTSNLVSNPKWGLQRESLLEDGKSGTGLLESRN